MNELLSSSKVINILRVSCVISYSSMENPNYTCSCVKVHRILKPDHSSRETVNTKQPVTSLDKKTGFRAVAPTVRCVSVSGRTAWNLGHGSQNYHGLLDTLDYIKIYFSYNGLASTNRDLGSMPYYLYRLPCCAGKCSQPPLWLKESDGLNLGPAQRRSLHCTIRAARWVARCDSFHLTATREELYIWSWG